MTSNALNVVSRDIPRWTNAGNSFLFIPKV